MTLPLVLAGPIIRRVEPRLCAIWIALREPAKVTVMLESCPASRLPGSETRGQIKARPSRRCQAVTPVVHWLHMTGSSL